MLEHIGGRIVTVSSTGHRIGRIEFDDLNWEHRSYKPWRAYGQSKLANLLFTAELQRRLGVAGSSVLAMAAHPGYADTNLQFNSEAPPRRHDLADANRWLAQDAAGGALPTLYAAVADIPGNSFAGPDGFMQQRGGPTLVGRSDRACDAEVARRLWDASVRGADWRLLSARRRDDPGLTPPRAGAWTDVRDARGVTFPAREALPL
jgi:NAD(P)-dependent dehydrogenase (short-subunit alcohol dehydrogenase family)